MSAFWLGETVGMALMSCVNPIVWISAFVFSKKSGHLVQAFKSGLVNLVCWLLIIAAVGDSGPNPYQVGIAAFLAGAVVLYILVLIRKLFMGSKQVANQAKTALNAVETSEFLDRIKSEAASCISSFKRFKPDEYSDEVFEKALEELDSDQPRKATWAKCLATSDGDFSRAKAKYIELRVKELSDT